MSDNRKLGQLEEMMEILNTRAKTWNVVTISRVLGNLQPEILSKSLDLVQYRHPRLKSRIIHLHDGWYFQTEGTQKITLRVVKQLHSQQWESVVLEELNQIIASDKCLWRVVLVQSYNDPLVHYLITTLHHAIADALSTVQLHVQILTYYHKISSGSIIDPVVELTALPPIEEILPTWTRSWRGKINSAVLFLKIAFQKYFHRPRTLKNEKYVSIPQRYSGFISRQIDPATTQRFIQQCHQEKTTVHSALSAILIQAIAKKVARKKDKNIRINYLSYIDLRRRIQPVISQENMGVLSTSMMGFANIQIGGQSIWKLAREVRKDLEKLTQIGDIFSMIKIAKMLVDFCFIFPHEIAASFSISNIGKVDIPKTYGGLELSEISFAGAQALYAGVLGINVATFQGKMILNFVFSQPSLSREITEELANDVISSIYQITDEIQQFHLVHK